MRHSIVTLGSLRKGDRAVIHSLYWDGHASPDQKALFRRLLVMGFTKGVECQIIMEAPYVADPIAVSIKGSVIGMRRQEANMIKVTLL